MSFHKYMTLVAAVFSPLELVITCIFGKEKYMYTVKKGAKIKRLLI